MATDRKTLQKSLLIGAALGALYVATRSRTQKRVGSERLVDWERAETTAVNIVRRTPGDDIADRQGMNLMYRDMVSRSVDIIRSYTRMELAEPITSVYVFDRKDWIRANMAGFRLLFDRVEEIQRNLRSSDSLAMVIFGEVNRQMLSTQLGVLVGYLARRVLGQYDLALLGKEAVTTGSLYFVEPNIARIERDLRIPGRDLRMWIALHETTHAYEFEGNTWLRNHFNSLLEQYFEGLNLQVQGLRGLGPLKQVAEGLSNSRDREGWIEVFMTENQRQLFRKLQAIMSLLEGYSNHIMNTVGEQILPDFREIRDRMESRRKRPSAADKLFARLTGLNVKMEQYRLGEIFVNEVVRLRGIGFMNQVWQGPEYLPDMTEIRDPARWVRRIEMFS